VCHAAKVDRADDIHVVQQEGLVHVRLILQEKPGCLLQAAAGIEQDVFAGNFDAHAEIVFFLQIVYKHVREVVNVDDDLADSKRL
jgi:hypothetical protein